MATTIKITQLPSIGNGLSANTILPVVNTTGTAITAKVAVGNIANFTLTEAGNLLPPAFVSTIAYSVANAAQPNITSVGTLTTLTSSGNITAPFFIGNVVGNISGNLVVPGTNTSVLFNQQGNAGTSNAFQFNYATNVATIIGNLSVTNISGNGAGLTSIAGANVSGFVANANVANTAFAVAGANVSGFVPNANIANTAFAVAGANVSGFVANANVANTAFAVAAANVSGLGNIATINLTGSNSNVLYGNGVFAPASGGGNANTGNVTFNDINIIGTGNLKLQPDSANASAYLDIFLTAGPDIHIAGNGETVILGTDDYANVAVNVNGNVSIQANAGTPHTWTFGTDGTTTFPTANIDLHNGGVQSGEVLQFGNPNLQSIITGPTPEANVNTERLIIQGQRGNGTGEGGDVYVWGGDADTNGGDIKIYAGDADNVSAGSGGYVNLAGGDGFDNGGDIDITGGSSANGTGGDIFIDGGSGELDGGNVSIQAGYGVTGQGGTVQITGGAGTSQATYGNVEIGSGTYVWLFDNTGNLTLPNQSSIVTEPSGNVTLGAPNRLKLTTDLGDNDWTWNFEGDAVVLPHGASLRDTVGNAVAIGLEAGYISQGNSAVAIGANAGYTGQGVSAVAIGKQAGETSQANNSIILNATGSALNQTTANTFTVKPVRGDSTANLTGAGFKGVYYNPTTGEFCYSTD